MYYQSILLSFIPALCCSCLLVLPPDILDKNNTFRNKLKFCVRMLLYSEKENSADLLFVHEKITISGVVLT